MRRILSAAYGALAYLAFAVSIGYLAGFLADVGVPKTVNRGAGPWGPSLLVDILLLLAFALQHSVMARSWFKERLERWIPRGLERSSYVLASSLLLVVVFALWRPIPMVIWDVSDTWLGTLAWVGFGAGWALAVGATFALSHPHLFGLSQAAAYARGGAHPRPALRDSRLYRVVRHPMTAGLLLALWCAPQMTFGHALFGAVMTLYSLVATVLEERDLIREFPTRYGRYREQVPALVPVLRPGRLQPRRGGLAWETGLIGIMAVAPILSVRGVSLVPPAPPATNPPMETDSLTVNGLTRTFLLFDPGNRDGQSPRPLVLALHGTGGTASRLRGFLGGALERAAADRGWVVAYPEAQHRVWSDCRARAFGGSAVDDVAFIRALVERLAVDRDVDPSRVYALGYSGGGHMAFRLAFDVPSVIEAIAVFGASPPVPSVSKCHPSSTTAGILMVNGTADPINPYDGGDVIGPTGLPLGRVLGSVEGARYLRELASGDADVRLISVAGGGHVVPGPRSAFPSVAGHLTRSFDGVLEAVQFFQEHAHGAGR